MAKQLRQPSTGEILRYLGYRGQELSAPLLAQIEACGKKVAASAKPGVIYRQMPVIRDADNEPTAADSLNPEHHGTNGVRLGTVFLPGEDIAAHLGGCSQAILMAATLGTDVEKLLRRSEISDISDAVIMDACATQLIEEFCDDFENGLRKEIEARGLYLTGRFSPGYGDLPITLQDELCACLDTHRKIGLTVSKTHFLIPRKSVTAILGISENPVKISARGCDLCSKKADCSYRKEKRKCNE